MGFFDGDGFSPSSIAEDIANPYSAFFNGGYDPVFDAIGSGVNTVRGFIPGVKQGQQAQKSYQDAMSSIMQKLMDNWQLPQYDQTPLTPQEFAVLSVYKPDIAAYVQQQQPQLISKTNDQATQAQNQALGQLSGLAKTGVDTGMQAQLDTAKMSADQAMRSRKAQALSALEQRGLGSSGATLGADITAGIGASEQQRQADLEAAAMAAQRKAQAIQGLGSLGSEIAGQEQQMGEFNASTLNNYNDLIANRRQQYQNYVANTQNQANQYNQAMNQNVADKNVALKNQYSQYNQQRDDQIKSNLANMSNQKYQTIAGMQGGLAGQQNQFAQQQAQDETKFFMNLAGMGANAAMAAGGGGGPASMLQGASALSEPNYGNVNPNYSLSGTGPISAQYSAKAPESEPVMNADYNAYSDFYQRPDQSGAAIGRAV